MTLHVPTPRLLPFTVALLAVVLAFKSVDLAHHAMASFRDGSAGGVVATAQAAVPEKPQPAAAEKPQPAVPVPASAPGAPAAAPGAQAAAASAPISAPPPVTDSERAVLIDLRQRRQELDARDATLSTRESILAAAEQKLTGRVAELTTLQKKLQDLEAARHQGEEAGWQSLVKLYETMKPRDAAVIFNDLQMSVLVPLVDRMKEAKAALIMAAMNPDKARDVTAQLAQVRTSRDISNKSAQKGS